MAFKAAAPLDAPPGIAPALVAAVPVDLTQLMQMLHLQMQQQQIAQQHQIQQQQAQQQHFADMMKHMLNMQNVSLPSVGGGVITATNKALGERHFRRIGKFDNKNDSWKEWRTHFLTAVRVVSGDC